MNLKWGEEGNQVEGGGWRGRGNAVEKKILEKEDISYKGTIGESRWGLHHGNMKGSSSLQGLLIFCAPAGSVSYPAPGSPRVEKGEHEEAREFLARSSARRMARENAARRA